MRRRGAPTGAMSDLSGAASALRGTEPLVVFFLCPPRRDGHVTITYAKERGGDRVGHVRYALRVLAGGTPEEP
jgi:hypothetical protein